VGDSINNKGTLHKTCSPYFKYSACRSGFARTWVSQPNGERLSGHASRACDSLRSRGAASRALAEVRGWWRDHPGPDW